MCNIQGLTYSQCYGSMCAKGAIFTQYCGYLGVEDNFLTSGISDTELFYLDVESDDDVKSILKKQ